MQQHTEERSPDGAQHCKKRVGIVLEADRGTPDASNLAIIRFGRARATDPLRFRLCNLFEKSQEMVGNSDQNGLIPSASVLADQALE